LVGFVIGAFWSIGSGLSERLVRPESTAKATAVIFSAVPLGSVLGVPAGTFIADLVGWRAAFVVMGVLTLGVFAALVAFMPRLPSEEVTQLAALRVMLRSRAVRVGLAITFLIVLAHFGTYTYVTPFLEDVTQVGASAITALLLMYGVAGVVGNFIAGALAARNVRATFCIAACMIAGATLLLPVLGHSVIGVAVLLVVWGLAYGGVPVCSQTWFIRSSPGATEAASVLFTSSFQATISIGALLGGVVVDASSTVAVMVLGGTAAVLMVLTVCGFPGPDSPGMTAGGRAGMTEPT
jgi:predicted MFS family arabinose efflux permease